MGKGEEAGDSRGSQAKYAVSISSRQAPDDKAVGEGHHAVTKNVQLSSERDQTKLINAG
eukprot:SAG31_NODE_18787_length_622_cov_1.782027_1_plen_58_part_01